MNDAVFICRDPEGEWMEQSRKEKLAQELYDRLKAKVESIETYMGDEFKSVSLSDINSIFSEYGITELKEG